MSTELEIDHLLFKSDNLTRTHRAWRLLGFAPTALSLHEGMGTGNHTIVLDDVYLELYGPTETLGKETLAGFGLTGRDGLRGLALRTKAGDILIEQAKALGIDPGKSISVARIMNSADGKVETAKFTVSISERSLIPGITLGFLFKHHTPDIVFKNEFKHHENGAVALTAVIIVSEDVKEDEATLKAVGAQTEVIAGDHLVMDLSGRKVIIATSDYLKSKYGIAPSSPIASDDRALGVIISVKSISLVKELLQENEVPYQESPSGIVVTSTPEGDIEPAAIFSEA